MMNMPNRISKTVNKLTPKQQFYLRELGTIFIIFITLTIAFTGVFKYAIPTALFLFCVVIGLGYINRNWEIDYPTRE